MIKRIVLAGLLVLGLAGLSFAAVEIKDGGTVIGKTETVNVSTGLSAVQSGSDIVVTVDGSQVITGGTINGAVIGGTSPAAATVTSLTVDGTIYTGKIDADGAIYPGRATVDPCATLGAGYIFFNTTKGAPCFCNNYGVDLSLYDGTTACF